MPYSDGLVRLTTTRFKAAVPPYNRLMAEAPAKTSATRMAQFPNRPAGGMGFN
jgi:hypothetical protein